MCASCWAGTMPKRRRVASSDASPGSQFVSVRFEPCLHCREVSLAQWIAVWGIVAVAACTQGSVGFGLNLLAAPLLVLVNHELVPAPLLVAAASVNTMMVLRERTAIDYPLILPAVFGRIPGAFAGLALLLLVDERDIGYVVAAVVLAVVVANVIGPQVTPTRPLMAAVGGLGGFTGTAAAIGGPPVALALSGQSGAAVRGSMGLYFISGSVVSISLLLIGGILDFHGLLTGLGMIPAMAIGFYCSRFVIPYLDQGRTRPTILIVSAVAAISLIVRLTLG